MTSVFCEADAKSDNGRKRFQSFNRAVTLLDQHRYPLVTGCNVDSYSLPVVFEQCGWLRSRGFLVQTRDRDNIGARQGQLDSSKLI